MLCICKWDEQLVGFFLSYIMLFLLFPLSLNFLQCIFVICTPTSTPSNPLSIPTYSPLSPFINFENKNLIKNTQILKSSLENAKISHQFSLNTPNNGYIFFKNSKWHFSVISLANSVTLTFSHENNENEGVETLPSPNLNTKSTDKLVYSKWNIFLCTDTFECISAYVCKICFCFCFLWPILCTRLICLFY